MAGFQSSGGTLSAAERAELASWDDENCQHRQFRNIDELEAAAVAAGDALTRRLMEQEFTQRLAKIVADGEAKCPDCGQPGESVGEEPRKLDTRRGIITIRE